MTILLTGCAQDVCAQIMQAVDKKSQIRIVAADDMLNGVCDYSKEERIVWLYRSPWAFSMDVVPGQELNASKALDLWLNSHRALLRKRRNFGSRLLLLNAEQVDYPALFKLLNLPVKGKDFIAAPAFCDGARLLNNLLEKSFESTFAEHWDVFVALNALAWQTRESSSQPEPEDKVFSRNYVLALFQLMADGRSLPHLKGMLAQAQTQAAQQAQFLESSRAELKQVSLQAERDKAVLQKAANELGQVRAKLESEVSSLCAENQTLLQQITRVQAELEKIYIDGRNRLAEGEKQRAKLSGELAQLQAKLKQQAEEVAASAAEVAKLKNQNAAAVAALEKQRQEAEAARKKLVEDSLAKERLLQQAVEHVKPRIQELEAENEVLLQQMRQVQEQLEGNFMENRQLRSDMELSRDSMDRARKVVSRLIAKIPGRLASSSMASMGLDSVI